MRSLVAVAVAIGSAAGVLSQVRPAAFPHEAHERLFPVCQGCHQGVEAGRASGFYPEPDACASCHDGVRAPEVSWQVPGRRVTTLEFSHPTHAALLVREGEEATCQTCHQAPGTRGRMDVVRAYPERCSTCHAGLDHPDGDVDCRTCHRPLTAVTSLGVNDIARFPKPESHRADRFLLTHAPDSTAAVSQCATCHARESCERCHVNASALLPVQMLAPDPRIAELLAGREAEYPVPASHGSEVWARRHGSTARDEPAACATCHTRSSCVTCHLGGGDLFLQLFEAQPRSAEGVRLDPEAARRIVHPPGFDVLHGTEGATQAATCGSCHAESFCTECHSAASTPAFHGPNFLMRHGSRVYGADTECVSCHSVEIFCRSCHSGVGLATGGDVRAGFHDAQPFWLLGHGQAARQNLQACVTCHGQGDCAACHAPLGGWGINPHGPGFDAARYRDVAWTGCILCHRGGIPPG